MPGIVLGCSLQTILQPGIILGVSLLHISKILFGALPETFRMLCDEQRSDIFDCMQSVVNQIGSGERRQVDLRFMTVARHYLFGTAFSHPADRWEKRQIKKSGQDDSLLRPDAALPPSKTWRSVASYDQSIHDWRE